MENPQWELVLSEDNLEAKLCLSPDFLGDIKELRAAVAAAGIKFGLLAGALEEALHKRGCRITIARGIPPRAGTDDTIIFNIPEEELSGEMITKLDQDLRFSYQVPSVTEGEVIAAWQPGQAGAEGQDVLGRILQPPKIRRLQIMCGRGTECTADGIVKATAAGRPSLFRSRQQYRFEVVPVYLHQQDLTIDMPRLKFAGDIVIKGNVTEGTSIEALGNVDILGDVIGAAVTAGQSVRVNGNIIRSTIQAGHNIQALKEAETLLEELKQQLAVLPTAIKQLQEQSLLQHIPVPVVVEKVLALRYPTYRQALTQLETVLSSATKNIPGLAAMLDWQAVLSRLRTKKWQSAAQIDQVLDLAAALQRQLQHLTAIKADIVCNYTLNSHLKATQNITIKRQGSYHSQLLAGDTISIAGIARGGQLQARAAIKVNKVGSEAGAATTLQVGKKGVIEVLTAYENTNFMVGTNKLTSTDTIVNSTVKLNKDARITLLPRS